MRLRDYIFPYSPAYTQSTLFHYTTANILDNKSVPTKNDPSYGRGIDWVLSTD
jgi:hypothetical protein